MSPYQRFFAKGFLAVIIGITASFGTVQAGRYVSFNGHFQITYPEDWYQVDYNTVDELLARSNAGAPLYNYEAVFAQKSALPFFNVPYLILSLEPVGDLSETQIDSVLAGLGKTFGQGFKYFPVADFMADLKSNAPNYDRQSRIITIYNRIVQNDQTFKENLITMKFYEKGIADFYFFAPDSLFETAKPAFQEIVSSFTTKDIESTASQEKVEIAKIDTTSKPLETSENKSPARSPVLWGAIVVVILAIATIMRRKRRSL